MEEAASSYEILGKLAEGGMTEIFLARAKGVGEVERLVVIKRLKRAVTSHVDLVQQFLDEARLAAQLQHPNVAQVFEVGKLGGSYFFAMEFVAGETLQGLMLHARTKRIQIPVRAVLTIAAAAAAGLHHAHERKATDGTALGILHGDVSPTNVMVSQEGIVKLVDFGIAKAGEVGRKISPYSSPEQCRGDALDRRSDLFSLGIVLWELLTLDALYQRGSDDEIKHAIEHEQPTPPSTRRYDVPAELDAIVLKLLATDAAQRFTDADELLAAIESLAQKLGILLSTADLSRMMRLWFGSKSTPGIDAAVDAIEPVVVSSEAVPTDVAIPQTRTTTIDRLLENVRDAASLISTKAVAAAATPVERVSPVPPELMDQPHENFEQIRDRILERARQRKETIRNQLGGAITSPAANDEATRPVGGTQPPVTAGDRHTRATQPAPLDVIAAAARRTGNTQPMPDGGNGVRPAANGAPALVVADGAGAVVGHVKTGEVLVDRERIAGELRTRTSTSDGIGEVGGKTTGASAPHGEVDDATRSGPPRTKTSEGIGVRAKTPSHPEAGEAAEPAASSGEVMRLANDRAKTPTGEELEAGELRAKAPSGTGARVKTPTGEGLASGELRPPSDIGLRLRVPTGNNLASGELRPKTPSGSDRAVTPTGNELVSGQVTASATGDRAVTPTGNEMVSGALAAGSLAGRASTLTGDELALAELRARAAADISERTNPPTGGDRSPTPSPSSDRSKTATGSGERIKTATGEVASGELHAKAPTGRDAAAAQAPRVFDDSDTVNLRPPQTDRHRTPTATGEPAEPVRTPRRRNRTATGEIAGGNIRTKTATGEIAVPELPEVSALAATEPAIQHQPPERPSERSRVVSGELGGKRNEPREAPPASASHLAPEPRPDAAAARESVLHEESSRRWLVPAVIVVGLGLAGLMYLRGRGDHEQPSAAPPQTAMAAGDAAPAPPPEPTPPVVTPAASIDAAVAVATPDAAVAPAAGPATSSTETKTGDSKTGDTKTAGGKTGETKSTESTGESKTGSGKTDTASSEPKPPREPKPTGDAADGKTTKTASAEAKPAAKSLEDMFQAGDFAGVNKACPKIVVFSADKLKMCAISACQTKSTALAKRWINAIEKSSRASLIATCKTQGVDLEEPAPAAPPPSSSSPPPSPPPAETPPSQ